MNPDDKQILDASEARADFLTNPDNLVALLKMLTNVEKLRQSTPPPA